MEIIDTEGLLALIQSQKVVNGRERERDRERVQRAYEHES